ncbi:MAG: glycosyltransferase family 4 protein [Planctomycetia bacterium]|nr:glycosyltransferase family 4 protein [Planctomycetia bacterium]
MRAARRRVAFVHPNLGFGGAERVLVEEVRALAGADVAVDVFLTGNPELRHLEPDLRAAHPRVERIEAATSSGGLARRLVHDRHALVVTCIDPRGLRAAAHARRFPWRRRPAVVAVVHSRYPAAVHGLGGRARAADVVVVTDDVVDALAPALGLPPARFAVARPLVAAFLPAVGEAERVAARALRASFGVGDGATLLGLHGRIAPDKGVLETVDAWRRLVAEGHDVHLVVAGRRVEPTEWGGAAFLAAFDDRRRAVAADPALARRFHEVGAGPTPLALLCALDLFLLPSQHEGLMPLAILEALAVGTPVVATAVGGIGRCLVDGRDAVLLPRDPDDGSPHPPGFPATLAAAVAPLLADPARRARLGEAGHARARALVATNTFHADFRAACDRALVATRSPPLGNAATTAPCP